MLIRSEFALSSQLSFQPKLRRWPQYTRSVTVESEGPNVPVEGRLIPWPEAPCYPLLTEVHKLAAAAEGGDRSAAARGLLSIGDPLVTTAGKTALGWAFKTLQLAPGTEVLMPAYHCLAMIEPLEWLGLKARYYKLNEDLTVDFADIESRIDDNCKALVAVHYFGFPQDGPRLKALCEQAGIAYIEDCAHSYFGARKGESLGTFGDLAIGSLPKFFPLRSGGCLVSNRHRVRPQNLTEPGWQSELQVVVRELQLAHYYGRLRPLQPLTFGAAAISKLTQLLSKGRTAPRSPHSPANLEFTASRSTRWILQACDAEAVVERRRENYRAICDGLADLPGVTLLKPRLEEGTVPYMVPLHIPRLRHLFARLEDRAVPMQRFGQFLAPQIEDSICPVSVDLSNCGLQLPCHQSLRPEEIDWLVDQVRSICKSPPSL